MADQWFYWHEAEILGPYSGKQLFDLATAGNIVPTDTVWKGGVERGVQASDVQHLFAAKAAVAELPIPVASPASPAAEATTAAVVADAKPAVATPEPARTWGDGGGSNTKKARATAGKGATIVGQDGKNVRFRMKCTTCGHEDSSWKTLTITRGTMRAGFYCQKCRKQRHAELQGHLG